MASGVVVAARGPAAARMLGSESVGPPKNVSHNHYDLTDTSGRGETQDRDSRRKKRRSWGLAAACSHGPQKGGRDCRQGLGPMSDTALPRGRRPRSPAD